MSRLVVAAGLVGLMLVPLAAATEGAFPGKPGKLVLQSNRDGDYELYTANANGSGVKKLLSRPQTDEFNPNWSPSGKQIVFQTGPKDGTNFDLWLVERDGTGAHAVLTGNTNDRAPQFCDFDTVVFTRQPSPTSSDVYSLDLDTRRLRRLTSHPSTDSFPTCHPTRNQVAFISGREGVPRVYVMTKTGAGQRPLVAAPSLDPDYSTDGTALAYVAPDGDRNLDVFTMNLATGAVTQRTNVKSPFEFRLPKFAPLATRSASARSGPDDKIVATQRDTSTTPAKETIYELVSGGARPVEDPASGGSVQPNPSRQCRCLKIDAEIDNAVKTVGPGLLSINLQISWTTTCTKGRGGCSGRIELARARKFRALGGGFALHCSSDCGRSNTVTTRELDLTSGNPKAADGGVVIRTRFVCEGKGTEQLYKLVFQSNGRFLDREQSDLNGNRVPDGKEK